MDISKEKNFLYKDQKLKSAYVIDIIHEEDENNKGEEDEFDLAAAATGVVENENLLGEHLVKAGDVAIAIESSRYEEEGQWFAS